LARCIDQLYRDTYTTVFNEINLLKKPPPSWYSSVPNANPGLAVDKR